MKRLHLYIIAAAVFGFAGCVKDQGNYTYHVPAAPVVTHLDTAYKAIVLDTLRIEPTITGGDPTHKLGFEWRIDVSEQLKSLYYYGPKLDILFGLNAERYSARFTVIDSTNGMKYVYPFVIKGGTLYSTGTLVLSQESGVSQLTFVLPNGTVEPRVYEAVNGEDLPPNAQQLVGMYDQYINNGTLFNYWILCSGGSNPGVQIDPSTLQKKQTLRDNFFSPPSTITPGLFIDNTGTGTLMGVLNGQMWSGTSQTAYFASTYGKFGLPASGNYALFHQAIFNPTFPYMLGYDSVRRQVVGFTNFGTVAYIGTGYTATATTPFDLTNVGLDLIDYEQINSGNVYMFGKKANDSVYEAMFSPAFMGYIQMTPKYIRPFIRQDLIKADTKWASSPVEIFFFTSGSTIYEYNPLNQSVKALTTDFGGKPITMLKASADGNTLTAGVEGTVYFLDVSTGQYGTVLSRVDGVPGSPVDVYVKTN